MQRAQARKPDVSSGSWEAVTLRFGSMADVAMESEGKAAGGWAAYRSETSLTDVFFYANSRLTFATHMVLLASYMRLHTELQNLGKLPGYVPSRVRKEYVK